MTKQPSTPKDDGGDWFLETVGVAPTKPSGRDALADLTRENEIVGNDQDNAPGGEDIDDLEEVGSAAPATAEHELKEPHFPAPVIEDQPTEPLHPADLPTARTPSIRTTEVTFSSFDGDPGTSNSTYDRSRRPPNPPPPPMPIPAVAPTQVGTATAVAAPPTPTVADQTEVDGALAPALRSRRSFRWPIVIFLIALIAAVVVAVLWLPRATRSEALAVRQSYYDTSSVVRNQLPEAQHALDVVTDPQSTAEALSSSIPIIAQLDTAAFDMKEAAAAPLPSVLPLMPSGEVDALVPLQQQQELLGEEGSGLANQLGNGYIYRVSVPDLLNPGNLPISADTETINTVSITLASSLAADAAIIAELPADPLFVNTYDQAIASHDRYEVWQNEYLGALTSEDTDRARTLIDELDAMRTGLQETNTDDLANFRSEVDNHIVTYAGSLESHLAALTEID